MKAKLILSLIVSMCFLVVLDIAYISSKHTAQMVSKQQETDSLKTENCELKVVVDTLSEVCLRKNIAPPAFKHKYKTCPPVQLQRNLAGMKSSGGKEDTVTFCTRIFIDKSQCLQ